MNKKGLTLTSIVFAVIAVVFIASMFKEEPLPEYTEKEEEIVETVTYDVQKFNNDKLEILIPVGWNEITLDNELQFVDSLTASTISIAAQEYNPKVNAIDENQSKTNIESAGYSFVSFKKDSNCSYKTCYTSDSVVYVEKVYWDFNTIYTVLGMYKPENYDQVYDLINHCIDSFNWIGNKIPNGYHLEYFDYGCFQMLVKDNWGASYSSDTITLTDPEYGMNINITVQPYNGNFTNLTQLDYSAQIAIDKNEFIQAAYNNTGNTVVSHATYTLNNQMVSFHHYLLATGVYQFSVTVEYYTANEEYVSQMYTDFINNFIYF